jgi:hypothetical protein
MTTILHVEHAVGSFEAWKRAFDSDPVGRKRSGVRRYRVLRATEDPNYVMIDLEFEGSNEAKAFRAVLRKLWDSEEAQELMHNPQLRIVELVETQEY